MLMLLGLMLLCGLTWYINTIPYLRMDGNTLNVIKRIKNGFISQKHNAIPF